MAIEKKTLIGATLVVGLGLLVGGRAAAQEPIIASFQNGYVSWTNVDPSLYYTVEYRPNLTGTNAWDGAHRVAQDVRSSQATITVPVGVFYRVVGSTNPMHTLTLSPANDAVAAGYYAATNLAAVDTDLATANIKAGMTIFGVTGKTEVVDTSSGNAVASDLMLGKTAYVGGAAVSGTIPTRTLSDTTTVVAAGYYAATNMAAVDTDLATANIKAGTTIFGVPGKTEVVDTSSGNALASDLMSGKTAYVGGAAVTGTILTRTLSNTTTTVSAGYYAATNLSAVDTDLTTANIKAGTAIFGVAGKTEVVDTSSGNAVASDLMSGKTAYVGGAAVTGTILTRTLSNTTTTVSAGYYAATNLSTVDTDLATANIKAGTTIFGVAGKPEVVDTSSGNALANDLMSGKTAYVGGAAVTGTIPTRTLSDTTTVVSAGYYAATNMAQVDTDLTSTNIRAGVTLFGIAGDSNVVDTSSGDATANDVLIDRKAWVAGNLVTGTRPPALVPKSVQTNSYATYDDGWYSTNVGVAWPNPRFTTSGVAAESNCVTDHLTGLMWLKNPDATGRDWATAIAYCEGLDGANGRGGYTDWRMPNVKELQSLLDYGWAWPALCDAAGTGHWTENDLFTGVLSDYYWSSTTSADNAGYAWYANLVYGMVYADVKGAGHLVWPVRGGH